MRFDFFMELRGREVVVEVAKVQERDESVGIMCASADEFSVRDLETGQLLELTAEEEKAVVQRSALAIESEYIDEPW